MWTALALIMTVLMGGFIAYNGDLIGRKFGKRRVTLFHLRPKHTAILITSVTGVLISGFTTAVAFILVPQVRDVILNGEEAIKQRTILRKDNANLNGVNIILEHKRGEMEGEIDLFKRQIAGFKQEQKVAKTELDSTKKQLTVARTQVSEEKRNLKIARVEQKVAEKTTAQLKEFNVEFAKQNTQLVRSNEFLGREIAQKQQEIKQVASENQEIAKQNLELNRVNASLSIEREKIVEILGRNRVENDRLVGENTGFVTKNKQLMANNSELVAANAKLVTAGTSFLTDWQDLLKRFESMRTKRIAVHGGEDLARIVVPAKLPEDEVRKYIDQLMNDANQVAQSKGARANGQSPLRAVQIVDKQFLTETPFGSIRPVTVSEQDSINAVVHKLTNSDSPVCVLALAVSNSPENEPAAIDFQPFNDWLVYPKGRQIGTRKMNAGEEPEKIYLDMMAFLKDVGQTAIERGMIPRIDPSSGTPEVGSLNWPELVRLVGKVPVHQGKARITAMALG